MATKQNHWAPIAKNLVDDLRKQWGLGWETLGPGLRQALAAERVLAVVCGWRTVSGDGKGVVEDATALRLEVMRLVNPERYVE